MKKIPSVVSDTDGPVRGTAHTTYGGDRSITPVRTKYLLAGLLGTALMLSACGGKAPNPIAQYQPGDEKRGCMGLKSEIATNDAEISRMVPSEDATGKNVALGVAGAFLIVPWFFMDFKDGEAVEINALRRRNQWLREVASEKDCSIPPPTVVFEDKPDDGEKSEDEPVDTEKSDVPE
jgi:hypothetical protein